MSGCSGIRGAESGINLRNLIVRQIVDGRKRHDPFLHQFDIGPAPDIVLILGRKPSRGKFGV